MPGLSSTPPPHEGTVLVGCIDIVRFPLPTTEGTLGRTCARCGIGVWLSPATAAAVAGRKYQLRCPDCIPSLDHNDKLLDPTPGQLAEIRNAVGPEAEAAERALINSPQERLKAVEEMLRRTREGEFS